jgi:hypothetical protein
VIFLRHSDIAAGDSGVDRDKSRAGHGLALGYPSQPVLGDRGNAVRVPPRDQLGLGARGRAEGFPTASWSERGEIGPCIITACPSFPGCGFIRGIDGNLWRFGATSVAKSALAGGATASSIGAASKSVPGIPCCRCSVGSLRCSGTHNIPTATLACVAQRRTTDFVELALMTSRSPKRATRAPENSPDFRNGR